MPYKDPGAGRAHRLAYNAAHREERKARDAANLAERGDEVRAKERAYRAAHPSEARKARNAAYHVAHREELKAKAKARDAANPEKKKASMAAWNAAHREEKRAYNTAYRLAHIEELRAKEAAYNAAHRDKKRAVVAAWRAADPKRAKASRKASATAHPETARRYFVTHPELYREAAQRAEAKRRGAPTCDHPACLALGPTKMAWQVNPHVCYLCGTPVWYGVNLHFDHVIPVVRGGVHCADNLRPACSKCNHRKHSKTPDEFRGA